jgi:hypothetical protein
MFLKPIGLSLKGFSLLTLEEKAPLLLGGFCDASFILSVDFSAFSGLLPTDSLTFVLGGLEKYISPL